MTNEEQPRRWTTEELRARKRQAERQIGLSVQEAVDAFIAETGWGVLDVKFDRLEITRMSDNVRRFAFSAVLDVRLDP